MNNKEAIKKALLGEPFSTANYRLAKDIMFSLMTQAGHTYCYRCGGTLARDTFSIEHKVNWQCSMDPIHKFFDLGNITFSHITCNTEAATYSQRRGPIVNGKRTRVRKVYSTEERRARYLKYEKKEK